MGRRNFCREFLRLNLLGDKMGDTVYPYSLKILILFVYLKVSGGQWGIRNLIYMGVHSKKRYLIGLHGSRKNPIAPYGRHTLGTPCA